MATLGGVYLFGFGCLSILRGLLGPRPGPVAALALGLVAAPGVGLLLGWLGVASPLPFLPH